MMRLCVFCGSSQGSNPAYANDARALGRAMAQRGCGLVFGAGHIGLMGVLADAVLEAGGEAIGVIPQALVDRELAHERLSELRIVGSMHERKAVMAQLADAFLALPGGFGTADEWFEMLTWTQLEMQSKPIGILNTLGFFDPLLAWIERAITEGFIQPKHHDLFVVASEAEAILDQLLASARRS